MVETVSWFCWKIAFHRVGNQSCCISRKEKDPPPLPTTQHPTPSPPPGIFFLFFIVPRFSSKWNAEAAFYAESKFPGGPIFAEIMKLQMVLILENRGHTLLKKDVSAFCYI
jgi:hypothetical protein